MSENKPTEIGTEQLNEVAGGSLFACEDVLSVLGKLTGAYEDLVSFSSHVIERVLTSYKQL